MTKKMNEPSQWDSEANAINDIGQIIRNLSPEGRIRIMQYLIKRFQHELCTESRNDEGKQLNEDS